MFYNEMKESLQKDIEVLLERHSREITKERLGDALNIIKDIDIAMGQLRRISDMEKYPLHDNGRPTTNDTYKNPWYDILKFFIETKQPQLIKLDYSSLEAEKKHRGTGKTSTIVRLSSEFGIPIYTNKSYYATGLIERNKELNLNAIIINDIKQLNLPQYSIKGIVLVDELTDISKIDVEKYIIIGFTKQHKTAI